MEMNEYQEQIIQVSKLYQMPEEYQMPVRALGLAGNVGKYQKFSKST